jgi:subtilisin family serine protease
VSLAALLLPFVVALPPGATAPPPGTLPPAARVTTLDRRLGLVLVRLPRQGVDPALQRLRSAPGVRYVERDAPVKLAVEGCGYVGQKVVKAYPGWRAAIHLSERSAAGIVIGIADSGVDDDRLAPRQPPLAFDAAGGPKRPQDTRGHGTAVASILVANRPDVKAVGIVPDATLLSARIARGALCSQSVLEDGLVRALGWLRDQGAQIVNISATATPSRALVDSLRALQLSGALVVAAVGNSGGSPTPSTYPAIEPGVLGVGALKEFSSTQVLSASTRGSQVDLVAPDAGIRVLASTAISSTIPTTITPIGTSFSAPIVTAAAAMVWATHRDWNAAEVTNALVRSATPLGPGRPNRNWGWGRLNVSRALHIALLPDPREPNDWVAAAMAQRPLHAGAVVVASLGYAGDQIDAYPVDVPAGTKAVLRRGGRGLTLRVLSVSATDKALNAVARKRSRALQISLPPGRHLLVVARSRGAGPYTLALTRAS